MYNVNDLNLDTLKGVPMHLGADVDSRVKAPTFVEDGILYLNCETEIFVADYYNEFGIEILSEVVEWADDHGGYWEWENPGVLAFHK